MIRALRPSDENELRSGWQMARCEPGSVALEQFDSLDWRDATVPGTVASSLDSTDLSLPAADLDGDEYWFRCRFEATPGSGLMVFDGLATLAEVRLNGRLLLTTDNMYVSYTAAAEFKPTNVLTIRFLSLNEALQEKRPRAKWRTQLAAHRNLRYIRTTLLGRMPGICPSVPPIGPWRAIRFVPRSIPRLNSCRIVPRLNEVGQGVVDIQLEVETPTRVIDSATALLGEHSSPLQISVSGETNTVTGTIVVDDPELWWPHTHGSPHRYPLTVRLRQQTADIEIPLPSVGFRSLSQSGGSEDFQISVNDLPIHCRGAVWMPADILTLSGSAETLRRTLTRCRDAGMNMLRLSGISTYESEDFYELCDELGILVWQDFMFARMDYPTEDPEFFTSIRTEAEQALARIAHRACLAVLCGGTEIRQQTAMLGLPDSTADNAWFDAQLPELCTAHRPDVLYVPHSPAGGALAFHADKGIGHYFAVGGYLQPLEAAELEPPEFASECLAFATPPEPSKLTAFQTGRGFDWPSYEEQIPRDNGAAWSFADVTDHYLSKLFSIESTLLKNAHPSLYLDASRIAVGETMKHSIEVWRRNDRTSGALILTLNDLAEGPGWGVLDSAGDPKAPYYFIRRAWSPVALYFRDRLTNGLWLGMHNDAPEALSGQLTIELARLDGKVISAATVDISLDPAGSDEWSVDELLGGFVDANYAYRFGPRTYEVAIASFTSPNHSIVEYRTLVDRPLDPTEPSSPELSVVQTADPHGVQLEISSSQFIDYLMLDAPDVTLSDNYLTVLPGKPRTIVARLQNGEPSHASIRAFNSTTELEITIGGAS